MNWSKVSALVGFAVLLLIGIHTALSIRELTRKNKPAPDA